jgi:hypothetical protein
MIIKCIKHGKIRIICRITLDQYHPSGLKALWMILVSRDDTAYDTDFAMYYFLFIIFVYYLEALISWKRVTWRSIKSGIARTLLIIVTPMQYTNLFLETSVLYTIYQCIFRNIRAIHDLLMYF